MELLRGEFDFTQDFTDERTGKVPSRVVGYGRRPAIGMTIKDVATFLANSLKAKAEKDPFHLPKPYDRQTAHTATSTC